MLILTQFVLRLSLGLAFAMAITSPRKVTSGFFRNHSYVLLGLDVLAALAAFARLEQLELWAPIAGAVVSYLCAVVWLYEKPKLGIALLVAVWWLSMVGAGEDQRAALTSNVSALSSAPLYQLGLTTEGVRHVIFRAFVYGFDPITGGLLLGSTLAAMFLGHWYLNSPSMELAPLRKLLKLMAGAIVGRAVVCFIGLVLLLWQGTEISIVQSWLLVLRWTAGIVGASALTWMSWETLKIPNTQSATGILYVAVIATFLGELTSLLLSSGTGYPL